MKKKTLKQVLEETALEVVTDKIKDYRKEVNNQINSALLSIIGLEKRGRCIMFQFPIERMSLTITKTRRFGRFSNLTTKFAFNPLMKFLF